METQAPAFEFGDSTQIPDTAIPPNIDEYVPLQTPWYDSTSNAQLDQGASIAVEPAQAIPNLSGVKQTTLQLVLCV